MKLYHIKALVLACVATLLAPRKTFSSQEPEISSKERLQRFQSACEKMNMPWATLSEVDKKIALRHILVNDKYNILFCYVPKVACSNWKRIIMVLDGNANDTHSIEAVDHKAGFVTLGSFPLESIQKRIKSYYKFMFVRDPLDRLVSAFKDKLTGGNDYYNNAHVHGIVQRFRKYNKVPPGTKGATLVEFFHYLIATPPETMDEHWMPFYQLCQPCAIQYDFIGSMENLRKDAEEVLQQMNVDDLVQFPRKQKMYTTRVNNPSTEELLANVPRQLVDRIVETYKNDYELFSYERPEL